MRQICRRRNVFFTEFSALLGLWNIKWNLHEPRQCVKNSLCLLCWGCSSSGEYSCHSGVTYLLLYSGIIFHPSISCWGLNEGDEYPGISLITIKAFKVQVLEGVLETRRELRHLQGCWFKPRRFTRVSLPFCGCCEGHLSLLQHSPLFLCAWSTLRGISDFAAPLAPLPCTSSSHDQVFILGQETQVCKSAACILYFQWDSWTQVGW